MTKLYTYKPRLIYYLLGLPLFYFMAKFFIAQSQSNASLLNKFCAVFLVVMVVVSVYFLILRFTLRQFIKVDENQIIVPKKFYSNACVSISYKDILGFEIKTSNGKRILHITYTKGEVNIVECLLPDKKSFDELYMIIVEKVQKTKQDSLKAKENSNNQYRCEQAAAEAGTSFFQTIAQKRGEDPLIGAKLGAKEIVQRLLAGMKDAKGVHIESLLCLLGALAGFSCQASVREEFVKQKGLSEKQVFTIVDCVDGRKYFFGDLLNKPLAECQYSVWSLSAGAAQQLGAKQMIDIKEIFAHVSNSIGSESFGNLRIAESHMPQDIPCNYLKNLWPVMLPVLEQYCSVTEGPIMFGLAIQEVMYMGKGVIDPLVALAIVMESAVAMSKVDFNSL